MGSPLLRSFSALALALVAPAVLAAQTSPQDGDFDVPGYRALVASPIGALPPYLLRDLFMERGSPSVLHFRYGVRKVDSIYSHAAAATGEFPLGVGRLGVTGGIKREDETTLGMIGAEFQSIVSRGMLTPDPAGPILHITIRGEVGFGTSIEGPSGQTVATGAVSIGMSVPFGRDIMIIPFAAPGLGFGMLSAAGKTELQPQVLVGGGVVIHNPSRLDLTLGVNRGITALATTVYGIGLTWNR